MKGILLAISLGVNVALVVVLSSFTPTVKESLTVEMSDSTATDGSGEGEMPEYNREYTYIDGSHIFRLDDWVGNGLMNIRGEMLKDGRIQHTSVDVGVDKIIIITPDRVQEEIRTKADIDRVAKICKEYWSMRVQAHRDSLRMAKKTDDPKYLPKENEWRRL